MKSPALSSKEMQSDYRIEEWVAQTPDSITYLATGPREFPCALTRLCRPYESGKMTTGGDFSHRLRELKNLKVPGLLEVLDGGLDQVDGCPWLVSENPHGSPVSMIQLSVQERSRILQNARAMVQSLGKSAGALSTSPQDVFLAIGADGLLQTKFRIAPDRWFGNRSLSKRKAEDVTEEFGQMLGIELTEPEPPAPPPTVVLPTEKNSGPWAAIIITGLAVCLGILMWFFFLHETSSEPARIARLPDSSPKNQPAENQLAEPPPQPDPPIVTPTPAPPPIIEEADFYTIEDEDELREMKGSKVTLRARVVEHKLSGSGKTHYLVLKSTKPEISVEIRKSTQSEKLTDEFLTSLKEKEIEVFGVIKLEGGKSQRLLISISQSKEIRKLSE